MRIKPVIELLKPAFARRKVAGAVTFAADLDIAQFSKDLYVFNTRRKDGENRYVNAHAQQRKHTFAVVIAARSINTPGGGDVDEQIEDDIEAITNALVGISLPGHDLPISSVGGALLSFKGGVALWQEDFETTTQFRRV